MAVYLLESGDYIEANLFKLVSGFYQDATIAERPVISTEDAALKAWLEENEDRLLNAMERAVKSWSIKGRAIHRDPRGRLHRRGGPIGVLPCRTDIRS